MSNTWGVNLFSCPLETQDEVAALLAKNTKMNLDEAKRTVSDPGGRTIIICNKVKAQSIAKQLRRMGCKAIACESDDYP